MAKVEKLARPSGFRKDVANRLTRPVVQLLVRTSVTPDFLTWLGFLLTVGAGVVIYLGHPFVAGWVVLIAGFFDMLDGALARRINRMTSFGAALDSILDRLSESVLLLAVLVLYVRAGSELLALLTGAAIIGSFMVSYIRARAEGLGLELKEGLFTRAERVVVLALGLLLNQFASVLAIAIGIIVVFSFFTAGQRLFLVWRKTAGK